MGTNQYLEWKKWKIKGIEKENSNFLKIYFYNGAHPPINFSKVFLENKGIDVKQIAIGKNLLIQPKVSGIILGMHMINDIRMT